VKVKFLPLLIGVLLIIILPASSMADQQITVMLDGEKLNFDVSPILENGRVMVPMRVIFEALDAWVEWDNDTGTITANNDNNTVRLTVGKRKAEINGDAVKLDVPVKVFQGRTLVPLRFVSEALGTEVEWQEKSQTVVIKYYSLYYSKALAQLKEGDLVSARETVITAPKKYLYPKLPYLGEASFSYTYFFPEGEALKYYSWQGDNLSYIEVRNDVFTVIWETLIRYDSENNGEALEEKDTISRFFKSFNSRILQGERGEAPLIEKPLVFFEHHPVTSGLLYGTIDIHGKAIVLGDTNRYKKRVVHIPDEAPNFD